MDLVMNDHQKARDCKLSFHTRAGAGGNDILRRRGRVSHQVAMSLEVATYKETSPATLLCHIMQRVQRLLKAQPNSSHFKSNDVPSHPKQWSMPRQDERRCSKSSLNK